LRSTIPSGYQQPSERRHHADELYQHAVTSAFENLPAVLGDLRVNQRTPTGFQSRKRTFLV
jgi:hypothetical protein